MASIERVVVQYIAEDGSSRRITLDEMRRHCRPERVEDLIDDLVVLCEDVVGMRNPLTPARVLSLIKDQPGGG